MVINYSYWVLSNKSGCFNADACTVMVELRFGNVYQVETKCQCVIISFM